MKLIMIFLRISFPLETVPRYLTKWFLEQKRNDLSFHLITERNQIILYIIRQDLSVYFISISSYLFAFSNMNSFIMSSND
jgi:hypothetical protein